MTHVTVAPGHQSRLYALTGLAAKHDPVRQLSPPFASLEEPKWPVPVHAVLCDPMSSAFTWLHLVPDMGELENVMPYPLFPKF